MCALLLLLRLFARLLFCVLFWLALFGLVELLVLGLFG
jgi:hypothetical protein